MATVTRTIEVPDYVATDRTTEKIAADITSWAEQGNGIDAVALGEILTAVLHAIADGADVSYLRLIIDSETAA